MLRSYVMFSDSSIQILENPRSKKYISTNGRKSISFYEN